MTGSVTGVGGPRYDDPAVHLRPGQEVDANTMSQLIALAKDQGIGSGFSAMGLALAGRPHGGDGVSGMDRHQLERLLRDNPDFRRVAEEYVGGQLDLGAVDGRFHFRGAPAAAPASSPSVSVRTSSDTDVRVTAGGSDVRVTVDVAEDSRRTTGPLPHGLANFARFARPLATPPMVVLRSFHPQCSQRLMEDAVRRLDQQRTASTSSPAADRGSTDAASGARPSPDFGFLNDPNMDMETKLILFMSRISQVVDEKMRSMMDEQRELAGQLDGAAKAERTGRVDPGQASAREERAGGSRGASAAGSQRSDSARQAGGSGSAPSGGHRRSGGLFGSIGGFFKNIVSTVAKIGAPILGTAIGGPIGGALGSMVGNAVGSIFGGSGGGGGGGDPISGLLGSVLGGGGGGDPISGLLGSVVGGGGGGGGDPISGLLGSVLGGGGGGGGDPISGLLGSVLGGGGDGGAQAAVTLAPNRADSPGGTSGGDGTTGATGAENSDPRDRVNQSRQRMEELSATMQQLVKLREQISTMVSNILATNHRTRMNFINNIRG